MKTTGQTRRVVPAAQNRRAVYPARIIPCCSAFALPVGSGLASAPVSSGQLDVTDRTGTRIRSNGRHFLPLCPWYLKGYQLRPKQKKQGVSEMEIILKELKKVALTLVGMDILIFAGGLLCRVNPLTMLISLLFGSLFTLANFMLLGKSLPESLHQASFACETVYDC